jgi:anti-anti-sigma factor
MTVVFDSSVGIRSVAVLRKQLLEGMEKGDLTCDLSSVERIDCSIAQLLIAAMREARKNGTKVRIKGVSQKVKDQFELCGLKYTPKAQN